MIHLIPIKILTSLVRKRVFLDVVDDSWLISQKEPNTLQPIRGIFIIYHMWAQPWDVETTLHLERKRSRSVQLSRIHFVVENLRLSILLSWHTITVGKVQKSTYLLNLSFSRCQNTALALFCVMTKVIFEHLCSPHHSTNDILKTLVSDVILS